MKYDARDLIKEALSFGFTSAGEINRKALVFMPEVRQMCAAGKCGKYGKCWVCPPACGTLEECAAKAAEYTFGILVQTTGRLEDDFDYVSMQAAGKKHAGSFAALAASWREKYGDILPMGSGGCVNCRKCTYPDAPCRFPDRAFPSMEAYGLWVSKVCELSGLPYNYGKLTLTYTSCCLLK